MNNNLRQISLAALMLLTLLLPRQMYAQESSDRHNYEMAKQMDIFNAIYTNLDLIYCDTLNPAETIKTGIDAMLHSLDPYTVYYPEEKEEDLKRMLQGQYGGIGALIKYDLTQSTTVIDQPYQDTPSAEAGLRKGDVILSIDGESMVGKDTKYVSEHLRGDAGTTFLLKVRRPTTFFGASKGTAKELEMKITRRQIQMPTLPYYGMWEQGVGYINLDSYTEGCSKEFRRAYVSLCEQGMKALVIDLRGNGGGSMQEAISLLSMFLPKGQLIVSTKGKQERANREYRTETEPIDTKMPICVLVDGSTASSSEITAGSLQDLDRAVVLGTRTYGKGLVQIVQDMPYNGNLKLTSAHYYIPSGRCIQAINYKHSAGGYKEHVADSLRREFKTVGGRTVLDGGGISPDVELKQDSIANIVYYLSNSGLDSTEVMHHWVIDYIIRHDKIAGPREFRVTDDELNDFFQRVEESGFKYDRISLKYLDDLERTAKFEGYYEASKEHFDALRQSLTHSNLRADLERNREHIRQVLQSDIVAAYYFEAGVLENSLTFDKQMSEAVRLLTTPEEYNKILGR